MAYTLDQSINWAQSFIEYAPLTAGISAEPAVSIATMIRNTILNAPFTWPWNRAVATQAITANVQDYTLSLTDFGFLEKVSLTDSDGAKTEIKDVYNTNALGLSSLVTGRGQRPASVSVMAVNYGADVTFRFMGTPDKTYTATFIYQKLAIPFGAYGITSVGTSSGTYVLTQCAVSGATTTYTGTITGGAGNAYVGMTFVITGFAIAGNNTTITVTASTGSTLVCTTTTQSSEIHAGSAQGGQAAYTGIFTPAVFPAGAIAKISGFATSANNGSFSVVSSTATRLVVVNPSAVAETIVAAVFNGNWSPIPDSFMEIYNNLFLAEAFQAVDDWQVSAQYRTRGIAALLSKAEGLNEMQRSAFLEQYLSRTNQALANQLRTQMGKQAQSI